MQTTKFTNQDADRLLRLADQFLENWALDAVESGSPDPEYEKRQKEWEAIRPLLASAPRLADMLERLALTYAHYRREKEPDWNPETNSRSLKEVKAILQSLKG